MHSLQLYVSKLTIICIYLYIPSGNPRVVRELLYLAAVYGGLYFLKYDVTADFWYLGMAKRLLNPPPEYITVSQATSGEVAVLLTDNCVAPTAVTYGQVAVVD